MKQTIHSFAGILLLLGILACTAAQLTAAPDQTSSVTTSAATLLKYKVISGFKQSFNDDLQAQLSQGWTPVGGISVTVWNEDLYFAQLLSKPATAAVSQP
jgi:hypothetical protein